MMKIEKISKAADELRKAIRAENSPTQMPATDLAAYEAVEAIIDAVVNELIIEWRRG
jgi:hypothetical protein